MSFDAFLKLDGIDGESQDAFHKDEIEILSFSWGEKPIQFANGSGAGSGRVAMGPRSLNFSFVKQVDKASPLLMLRACEGNSIKQGTLTCRKAGGTQALTSAAGVGGEVDFLKVVLSDIFITDIVQGGVGANDAAPMDQVSLSFQKFEITVMPAGGGDNVVGSCSAAGARGF